MTESGPPADPGPKSEGEALKAELLEEVKELVRAEREGRTGEAQSIKDLPPTKQLEARDRAQDIGLKRIYAWVYLVMMGVQILIADTVFVLYAELGVDWRLPSAVIIGWLSATVVEVIGVVLVVTRSLFPIRE